jgi:hypothetical protein
MSKNIIIETMKRLTALVVTFLLTIASSSYCYSAFSDEPPTEADLKNMIQVVFDNNVERFCFEGYSAQSLFDNAEAIFKSFGKSAEITVQSVEIIEVGKYKEYWPIRVHATGSCQLEYRSDFAQHSPAFSKWRGRTLTRGIDTVFGVDVREDDFGKPQIRLRK